MRSWLPLFYYLEKNKKIDARIRIICRTKKA